MRSADRTALSDFWPETSSISNERARILPRLVVTLPEPGDHRAAALGRLAEEGLPGGADVLDLVQLVARFAPLRDQVDERLAEHLGRARRVRTPRAVGGDDVGDAHVFAGAVNLDADSRRVFRILSRRHLRDH